MPAKNKDKKEASQDLRERAKIEKALTRLDIIRAETGLSQKEFAKRIGLSETRYNTIERGTNTLQPAHAIKIALEFNVSLDYIYMMDVRRSINNQDVDIHSKYSYKELMAAKDLIDKLLTDFASYDNEKYHHEKNSAACQELSLTQRVKNEESENKKIQSRNAKLKKKS